MDIWLGPDLYEVVVHCGVPVVFAMPDAGTSARELYVSPFQDFEIAHTVLVLELSIQDVAPDQEFVMWVSSEAGPSLYAVLIDDSERSPTLELRVEIGRKAEGVICVEPAMICVAAIVPWSFGNAQARG